MKQLHFGVDYYPEHWERSRWEKDAVLMQELGIQMVRMAEFSWHKLQPAEDVFDFSWLDEAVGLLGRYGIYTIRVFDTCKIKKSLQAAEMRTFYVKFSLFVCCMLLYIML